MNIELINTGNELLLGTTLNTHAAWIGRELLPLGLRLSRQVTVPDGGAIREEIERALVANDVVIVTGGLGPTSDDLTREETAQALGLELIEDEFAVRSIRHFFSERGRQMAECNLKQALIPCGADVLPNPMGTAPGVYLPPRLGAHNCAVFLLPGPPSELRPMVANEMLPRMRALAGDELDQEMCTLSFCGVGESDFHATLDARLNALSNLEVGYCARPGDIDLRLIGSKAAIEKGRSIVKEFFKQSCYSENGESIEQVIVALLAQRGWKISTAESCTGGAIASRITDVPGASDVFGHGFVTYSNAAKIELLGVDVSLVDDFGAVSEQVVKAMALGALEQAGSDLAIAVSGIAGPSGGCEKKPVGTVWMAIAAKNHPPHVWSEFHPRGREIFKVAVCQRLLSEVWRLLQKV